MLGAAVTVSYGLATGFERSARRADLPDVIARFEPLPAARVDARLRALPNVAARSYRLESTDVTLEDGRGRITRKGVVQAVRDGRRGYAIVAGRDLSGRPGEVVVERGLASAWRLHVGERLAVGALGPVRIVGVAVAPDNVAYPVAGTARVYVAAADVLAGTGTSAPVNMALVWVRDRGRLDETLVQARTTSFGIGGLRLLTLSGVRLLIDEAAGIVIGLLVAFSVVALGAAGIMLAASVHAEVQRRLPEIGIERALGFPPRAVAARDVLEVGLVALPAAAAGLAGGALLTAGPRARLLETLNELPPGPAIAVLAGAVFVLVALAGALRRRG